MYCIECTISHLHELNTPDSDVRERLARNLPRSLALVVQQKPESGQRAARDSSVLEGGGVTVTNYLSTTT